MKVAGRKKARELAMQAIYSWQMSGNPVAEIELNIATQQDMNKVDMAFFQDALRYVAENCDELDEAYKIYVTDRPLADIDPIEKAILRLATFEFIKRIDVPYKVVINEAIELGKEFGSEDSHKFVNGVLDKAVRLLRKDEVGR